MNCVQEIDARSEEYRVYDYGAGLTYRIDNPVTVHILKNEATGTFSQRVTDAAGVTHRPSTSYVAINWKPREGQPAFVA
jgi:hypothetical protein